MSYINQKKKFDSNPRQFNLNTNNITVCRDLQFGLYCFLSVIPRRVRCNFIDTKNITRRDQSKNA